MLVGHHFALCLYSLFVHLQCSSRFGLEIFNSVKIYCFEMYLSAFLFINFRFHTRLKYSLNHFHFINYPLITYFSYLGLLSNFLTNPFNRSDSNPNLKCKHHFSYQYYHFLEKLHLNYLYEENIHYFVNFLLNY